jgi:nitroreductase
MGLLPEIEHRYTAKDFLDSPVDRDCLLRIVEAGRQAPSAKNRQAWRFIVVTDPSIKARIADAAYGQDTISKAPAVIAICTTNIDYKMPNGQLSYPVDCGIASAFMMLQACHEGLASCAVTTFLEAEVRTILTMPYGMKIVLMLAVGHAADPQPLRDRLPLARIHSFNSW